MSRAKSFASDHTTALDAVTDGEDKLVLIDDATFVSAFAEAGQRRGKHLVCVRCSDPTQTLRALVLLVCAKNSDDELAGSVGFCRECYRGLSELLFHEAILRATKPAAS